MPGLFLCLFKKWKPPLQWTRILIINVDLGHKQRQGSVVEANIDIIVRLNHKTRVKVGFQAGFVSFVGNWLNVVLSQVLIKATEAFERI